MDAVEEAAEVLGDVDQARALGVEDLRVGRVDIVDVVILLCEVLEVIVQGDERRVCDIEDRGERREREHAQTLHSLVVADKDDVRVGGELHEILHDLVSVCADALGLAVEAADQIAEQVRILNEIAHRELEIVHGGGDVGDGSQLVQVDDAGRVQGVDKRGGEIVDAELHRHEIGLADPRDDVRTHGAQTLRALGVPLAVPVVLDRIGVFHIHAALEQITEVAQTRAGAGGGMDRHVGVARLKRVRDQIRERALDPSADVEGVVIVHGAVKAVAPGDAVAEVGVAVVAVARIGRQSGDAQHAEQQRCAERGG